MPERPPRTYDEIVRRTVPNPDSSWRPSREQEMWARQRGVTPEIQAIADDIHDALVAAGIDTSALRCIVDAEHVVVRGWARDRPTADWILEIVERIPGVTRVVDQITIG